MRGLLGRKREQGRWIKADRLHTLIPRESDRWRSLYRDRAAVEREFGRLKHEWAMLPLRVRRIERVGFLGFEKPTTIELVKNCPGDEFRSGTPAGTSTSQQVSIRPRRQIRLFALKWGA